MEAISLLLSVVAIAALVWVELGQRQLRTNLQWTNKRLENLVSQTSYLKDSARNAEIQSAKTHDELVMLAIDRKLVREKNVQELNEIWRKLSALESSLKTLTEKGGNRE